MNQTNPRISSTPLLFYRRGSTELEEEIVLGSSLMHWVYQTKSGKPAAWLLFRHAVPSRLTGWFANLRWSKRQISRVIHDLNIDITEFAEPPEHYASFNDFFTRKLKEGARPFDPSPECIASPADGRVFVYPQISRDWVIPVKGKDFLVDTLLGQKDESFYNGSLALIRLCPADYHRFHFPLDSQIIEERRIPGHYHSVNPLALGLGIDVFSENERHVSILKNSLLGKYAFIEVGAFGVGSIIKTFSGTSVNKGDEKGYFQYGGSTIILLFQPGRIQFAEDLVAHSTEGYETFLKAGEELARIVK